MFGKKNKEKEEYEEKNNNDANDEEASFDDDDADNETESQNESNVGFSDLEWDIREQLTIMNERIDFMSESSDQNFRDLHEKLDGIELRLTNAMTENEHVGDDE